MSQPPNSENNEEALLTRLLHAVETEELVLPAQPAVALRIRNAMEDASLNNTEVAKIIEKDAAIAAKLIRIANSAFMRGRMPVESLHGAITRLGISYTRNVVIGLSMSNLFQPTNEQTERLLTALWDHTAKVASFAQVLADHHSILPRDQVVLAGLVHNIGTLPILAFAEEHSELLEPEGILERVVNSIHPRLGNRMLESWGFPSSIALVPLEYLSLEREAPKTDIIDIVLLANILAYRGTNHPLANPPWETITALKRMGITPAELETTLAQCQEEIVQGFEAFST